jgi:outer membrane immunogenic protein
LQITPIVIAHSMNKTLAATLLAALPLTSTGVHAGDLGLAPATYDWSGAYVGVLAGGALDNVSVRRETDYAGPGIPSAGDQRRLDAAHDRMTSDTTGFTGGVSAGYNWQMEQMVFGLEADINSLGLNGNMKRDITGLFDEYYTVPGLSVINRVNYEIDAYGTVRGRLGFAIDNVLLFGTGGLAYAHMQANSAVQAQDWSGVTNWRASESDWNLGWTAGGGIEYGIGRWSLGVEYFYVDLQSLDWQSPSRRDLAARWETDYSFSVLRATGKVRF